MKKAKKTSNQSTTTKKKTVSSKINKNKETKATKAKITKGTAELGGKKINFRKGGLHKSLKVPNTYRFKTNELQKINKIPDGQSFIFHSDKIKMTKKIHQQLTLGLNLMKRRKPE